MAEGRMIKKEISKSKKIASLKNERARSLYFMVYPHTDVAGRISAEIDDIKAICIPLFKWNNSIIEVALIALHNIGLITLYIVNDKRYLEIIRFHDFQRINKDREAKSKIPSPNSENSRVIQSTPENSSISKVKLSKDNIYNRQPSAGKPVDNSQKTVDNLLKEVYKDGLNIYALINKLKKQLKWSKDKKFPPEVLLKVCEQYTKDKDKITKQWPWFIKVIELETSQYFARQHIKQSEEYKKGTMSLKEIFAMAQKKE